LLADDIKINITLRLWCKYQRQRIINPSSKKRWRDDVTWLNKNIAAITTPYELGYCFMVT
jgi:hypothetical protein